MTLAVISQVTSSVMSNLSLGEWLALIATALSIGAGVWRVAVVSTRTGQLQEVVERDLAIINEKLDRLTARAEEADKLKIADVRWATETTTRLGSVERRVEIMDTERRSGVPDRRTIT